MPDLSLEATMPCPVAGVDEAGCGPWAGPIVAAAAIINGQTKESWWNEVTDSKKLSTKKRAELYNYITSTPSVIWSVAVVDNIIIDEIGIGQANRLVFKQAVEQLSLTPKSVLIDGIRTPQLPMLCQMVVKGDSISLSIAIASIIAKVYRDKIMEEFHRIHPQYHWNRNAGYGTKSHIAALKDHGVSDFHRKSFKPIQLILAS